MEHVSVCILIGLTYNVQPGRVVGVFLVLIYAPHQVTHLQIIHHKAAKKGMLTTGCNQIYYRRMN